MNNKIEINDIVKITQMPKIFSQLEKIGKYIEENISDIDTLEVSEDNKQVLKQRRTEINNALKELEDRRKFIKTKILEPYETFNEKYENECKTKLKNASDTLKEKIDFIENSQLEIKKEQIRNFAEEHIKFNHLENIIKFEDIPLNINLSCSMKSLETATLDFIKKVSDDVECISSDENRDELLYEYQHNGFNYTNAVITIRKKLEEINKLREQQEKIKEVKEEEVKVAEVVEEITMPKEIEEKHKWKFTIEATQTEAMEIKEFIESRGIEIL